MESGKNNLETLLDDVSEYLDKFEKSIKLPIMSDDVTNEASVYLNMSSKELNKLSKDEIQNAAYLVSQYSVYIQRQYNREQSTMDFIDYKMTSGISSDDRREFMRYRTYSKLRAGRIAFIANRIEQTAKILAGIRR